MKLLIVSAATMMLAGCSYLPTTNLLNSSTPDKQMSYRFDTSQTAAEPQPEEKKPAKSRQAAKKQQSAKKQKAVKQPAPEPGQQPAEQPEE